MKIFDKLTSWIMTNYFTTSYAIVSKSKLPANSQQIKNFIILNADGSICAEVGNE